MLQAHNRLLQQLIILTDVTIVALAVMSGSVAGMSLMGMGDRVPAWDLAALTRDALAVVGGWWLMALRTRFYQSRRTQSLIREWRALIEAWSLGLGLACLVLLGAGYTLSFQPLATFLVGFLGIGACRVAIRLVLRRLRESGENYRRVLIIGRGHSADSLIQSLSAHDEFGIRVVGSLHFTADPREAPGGVACLGSTQRLKRVLVDYQTDSVVICPSMEARAGEIQEIFDVCDEAGIECLYAPDFFSMRNLQASVTWLGDIPAFTFSQRHAPAWGLAIKRGMDVVGASIGILLGAPALIACALAVKLQDGGPILFRQQRVGKDGKLFNCLKFRSMCLDAEAKKSALAAANEAEGPVFKIKRDPRITGVGRLLRKYSLDELPQLFNVLRGDMSLVGPRPPVPQEVAEYEWWQRRRISVRPGLTCVWQVWGRNRVSFRRWVEMDLYYIDNWSLWLDFKLIAHTMRTVIAGTGM